MIQFNQSDQRYWYHATYTPRLKSIMKDGLIPGKYENWSDSEKLVYLADDPDVAQDYCETADVVDRYESWFNKIVILQIDTHMLDNDFFVEDDNIIDNDGSTMGYADIIPVEAIKIYRMPK